MKRYLPLLIIPVWVLCSQLDYDDAVASEAHYCDMVAQGVWPDPGYCQTKEVAAR